MIKVTVDRKTWYRGNGYIESRLLRGDGERCCIGFLGKTLGIANKQLLGAQAFGDMSGCVIASKFEEKYGEELVDAYVENDNEKITDKVRETRLKKIGKKMGVEFTFIN